MIAPFWADLEADNPCNIFVKNMTNPDCVVIQWENVYYNPGFYLVGSFQVILYENVDIIFKALSDDIPTLSRTTVYNTLKLFIEKKTVQGLTISENEMRFDADTRPHLHFICDQCGMIYDLFIEFPEYSGQILDGHKITEQQVYLKGICKNHKMS